MRDFLDHLDSFSFLQNGDIVISRENGVSVVLREESKKLIVIAKVGAELFDELKKFIAGKNIFWIKNYKLIRSLYLYVPTGGEVDLEVFLDLKSRLDQNL